MVLWFTVDNRFYGNKRVHAQYHHFFIMLVTNRTCHNIGEVTEINYKLRYHRLQLIGHIMYFVQ